MSAMPIVLISFNWRASEASETLSGLFNRESRYVFIGRSKRAPHVHRGVQSRFRMIYVIVKARQRGNYAANSPSLRALARGRGLLQHNFRGNLLL